MDAKITVTTECGAKCKTCPSWKRKPEFMSIDTFLQVYQLLNENDMIKRILINNTGDIYRHPKRNVLFEIIESDKRKQVIITTNGAYIDYIPYVDEFIISFNGGDKETYEYTTGLNFETTINNIKRFYPDFEKIKTEIHCLIWEGNQDCEDMFKNLWSDFPGRLKISYKYDNQFDKDYTIKIYKKEEKIICDYIRMLSIDIDGTIRSCAHDFNRITNWGNILTNNIYHLMTNIQRKQKYIDHKNKNFSGLCEKCNYNTNFEDRIFYVN